MHKTMALVKAMLRVKRGDDATTDEAKASADGALVPAYAPKADERASLILKTRSLQFRVLSTTLPILPSYSATRSRNSAARPTMSFLAVEKHMPAGSCPIFRPVQLDTVYGAPSTRRRPKLAS